MAKDTKERILDEALALFTQQGVAGTSIVNIEAASGLSPGSGSFYRHFKDKDDVLRSVVDRELERVAEARKGYESAESLEEEYLLGLQSLDDMRGLIALLAREGSAVPELFSPVREVMAEGGTRAVADRLRARTPGGPDDGDVDAIAAVVMFALVGHYLAEQFFGLPIGVDRQRFVAALADLVSDRPPRGSS